jgi:hypothetical protein
MLSWLIVLCLLAIVLRPAAPPLVVVAVKSAIGVVAYPAVPTVRAEGDGLRKATGLSEDPDERDSAQVVGCARCSGLRVCEGCRTGAGFDGCSG